MKDDEDVAILWLLVLFVVVMAILVGPGVVRMLFHG